MKNRNIDRNKVKRKRSEGKLGKEIEIWENCRFTVTFLPINIRFFECNDPHRDLWMIFNGVTLVFRRCDLGRYFIVVWAGRKMISKFKRNEIHRTCVHIRAYASIYEMEESRP